MKSLIKYLNEASEDMLKTGAFSDHKDIIKVGDIIKIDNKELFNKYADEIWEILELSYRPFGGIESYRNKNDFKNKNHFIKAVIRNNEILACETYRRVEDSMKVVSYGCDQTTDGKLALQQLIQDDIIHFDLHYWAEVSDAIEHYFKKYNGFPMPNDFADEILNIDKSKIIKSENDNVHYERAIGINRNLYNKMIFGIKSSEIFDKVLKSITSYEDFMKNVNKLNESENTFRYSVKQAIYIIENIYRIHDEEGFNELIPEWHTALIDSLDTLRSQDNKDDKITTYIGYANYLLDEMPLLTLNSLNL